MLTSILKILTIITTCLLPYGSKTQKVLHISFVISLSAKLRQKLQATLIQNSSLFNFSLARLNSTKKIKIRDSFTTLQTGKRTRENVYFSRIGKEILCHHLLEWLWDMLLTPIIHVVPCTIWRRATLMTPEKAETIVHLKVNHNLQKLMQLIITIHYRDYSPAIIVENQDTQPQTAPNLGKFHPGIPTKQIQLQVQTAAIPTSAEEIPKQLYVLPWLYNLNKDIPHDM